MWRKGWRPQGVQTPYERGQAICPTGSLPRPEAGAAAARVPIELAALAGRPVADLGSIGERVCRVMGRGQAAGGLGCSLACRIPISGASATLKLLNEDFIVTELPLQLPCGEGEHIWLDIEKNGANTAFVAQQLGEAAGVQERDVGYAGLEDRHAITRQWFSVYLPSGKTGDTPDLTQLRHPEIKVLKQGIYLSAVRSFVFNEVLALRIQRGLWGQTLPGDLMDEAGRPTGPLWGRGRLRTTDEALALEMGVAERHTTLCDGMEHAGPDQERRALVASPLAMSWIWPQAAQLVLTFCLPAGNYATSVLNEILRTTEPDRRTDDESVDVVCPPAG